MKKPKIGLTIAILILIFLLWGVVLFVAYTSDEAKAMHIGNYILTEYSDGTIVKHKGSAVVINKNNTPKASDSVYVKTEEGFRVLYVRTVEDDTLYLNDAYGDITEVVSLKEAYIGTVDVYVPMLGSFISFVNGGSCMYLLVAITLLALLVFGILAYKLLRFYKDMTMEFEDNNQIEEYFAENEPLITETQEKPEIEVFDVFFSTDYSLAETKSLVKMILKDNTEKLKVGITGDKKKLVIDAIKQYVEKNDISNVKIYEKQRFSYIECEKDFTIALCSIILIINKEIFEPERNTDA